jgi:DNA-binding PadR family transcriptional regulator
MRSWPPSQERYGFELVRLLTEDHGFSISEGTIYPLVPVAP